MKLYSHIFIFFISTAAVGQTIPNLGPPYNQEIGPILGKMQKAQNCNPDVLLRVTRSPYSVKDTTDRIIKIINQNKLQIFSTTNLNQDNQYSILPGQVMIMFSKPSANPKLSQQRQNMNLEVPLRILIGQMQNQTYIAYVQPSDLPKCYDINPPTGTTFQELDQLLLNIVTQAIANP